MKATFLLISFLSVVISGFAQDRLKPGSIYEQGQEIFAPLVGYKGVVPEGWFGTLPQEEEVFLMIPNGNSNGFMFINANHMNLSELRKEWNFHLSLTDEIVISIKGEPKVEGNRMTGEFEVTGSREPFVGHAVAIDGGHGWTITLILLSPVSQYDAYRKNFDQLVASSIVEEPSIGSIYGDFNWPEFLKNKYLMSYLSSTQYKEQNEVWLCGDGTFKSKIKTKGMLKVESSAYKGKKKGTWTAEGIGEKGKLHLYFTKNDDLVLDMEIKDDKIFINGGRFFALENTECK
ncbi:MAG: hypothetical protein KAI29_09130 [Cyclobacteriaceae bacterium]|nr:hypothetical protein [Cyclobacteriaceae bacterium]